MPRQREISQIYGLQLYVSTTCLSYPEPEASDIVGQYNRVHAAGYLSMDCELDRNPPVVPLDTIRQRLKKLEMKGFYNHLSVFANYGPTYRRVLSCYHGLDASGREELLVEIRGSGSDLNE